MGFITRSRTRLRQRKDQKTQIEIRNQKKERSYHKEFNNIELEQVKIKRSDDRTQETDEKIERISAKMKERFERQKRKVIR